MPACLAELAFISNAKDSNLLKNKQEEFAVAIAKGICKFLGVKYVEDKIRKNCVLYSNTVDKTIAEVLEWVKEDCLVQDVKEFKSWSAENLYIVGGKTEEEFKKKNFKDRYTVFNGVDRWDTLDKVIKFCTK